MAETTIADFTIYQDEMHSQITEVMAQEINAFNEASNGAIRISRLDRLGEYNKETFFAEISGLVSRRDNTSVSAATDKQLVQKETVGVKLNRKVGPVLMTRDAFRKVGMNPQVASLVIGRQAARAILTDYLNTALSAARIAIEAELEYDYSGTGSLVHAALNSGMATLGDASPMTACWVMRSKSFHDLVGSAITDKITNVADVAIYGGGPGTIGKPVVVSDAVGLLDTTPTPDHYYTLGLVENAILIEESEQADIVNDLVSGNENLMQRVQGEHAFNLTIKGFAWDITNGGANPDDTALTTASNWDKVASDDRNLAGFAVETQ